MTSLPNEIPDRDDWDMYSMEHRISLGTSEHNWFILIGIDYVDRLDSRGSMLTGMSSITETFPELIERFELCPLDPSSNLLVLTSNCLEDGFPQSAFLIFKSLMLRIN